MKWIPFYPLFNFLKIILTNGGLSFSGIKHSFLWVCKTVLLEPFRWCELMFYERRVVAHKMQKDPIFILGHYRSGTTYLQRLFMQDKRFGYMSIFQSALPELMFVLEKPITWMTSPILRLFKIQNPFHRISFNWNFPGEEDVGMTALLNESGAQWGMLFPAKAVKYFHKYVLFERSTDCEKKQWLKDYLYLVKKLSYRNKGKRLVLKSPPNTARIRELVEIFPNAVFVFIHRHPLEVYASMTRFWNVIHKNYVLGPYKSVDLHQSIVHSYEKMMQRYMWGRNILPAERLIEIGYEELVENPVVTMGRVYSRTSMEFEPCREAVTKFAAQQRDYRSLKHSLGAGTERELKDRFRPIMNAFNYH